MKSINPPKCGGKFVNEFERVATVSCNTGACHVDGGWSDWEPWSNCTEPKQQITRRRYCNAPHKQGLGKGCLLTRYVCQGASVLDRTCGMQSREVNMQTETRLCNHAWEQGVSLQVAEDLDTELEAISDA